MISSWSYSKLIDFEQCPYRVKLRYVDNIPGIKAPAAERGTAIHQMAEDYVRGKIKTLPSELRHFKDDFTALHAGFKNKIVHLEGEWGFNKDWMPTKYKGAWLRMKADAIFYASPAKATVIDYKTGKSYGNELKHGEQTQLYAIAVFIRNPEIQTIITELWYLDRDELTSKTYAREEALRYVQPFDKRARALTSCKDFPARANQFTCKWCDYGPAKGGQCEFGVREGESPIHLYRKKFT